MLRKVGLNPCCNGRWSRTVAGTLENQDCVFVLILVVMEDGLVQKDDATAE